MKKLILTLFITAPLFGEPFFCPFSFKDSFTLNLDDKKGAAKDRQSLKGSAGLTFDMPLFNDLSLSGAAFGDLKKTELTSVKDTIQNGGADSLFEKIRYGAEIKHNGEKISFKIKGGTLSYSKTLSRLKNPVPPAVLYPFSQTLDFYGGIEGTVPYLSSTERSPSLCAVFTDTFTGATLTAEGAYFMDGNSIFSAGTKIYPGSRTALPVAAENKTDSSYNKNHFFTSTLTGGRFFLENNSYYLQKHRAQFKSDFYNALCWENYYSTPEFKALVSAGYSQSPWDTAFLWINAKGQFVKGPFLFNAGYFILPLSKYAPEAVPMIGASSSIIKTPEQGSFNARYTFLAGGRKKIILGLSALENWKICGSSSLTSINTAKIKTGIQIESVKMRLTESFSYSNLLLGGTPPDTSGESEPFWSINSTMSTRTQKFNCSLSGAYSHYPYTNLRKRTKDEINFRASLNPRALKIMTVSSQYTVNFKDGQKIKNQTEISALFRIKRKNLYSSFKVVLSLE